MDSENVNSEAPLQIVFRDIDELVPYENNPRDNAASIKTVANSIQQFGFKVPYIIDKKNVIVAGHTRRLACLSLIEKYGKGVVPMINGKGEPNGKYIDVTKAPCVLASDLSEEQIRAFRIADNKVGETSTWNMPMLDLELLELGSAFDMSMFGFPVVDAETEDNKKTICSVESMEIKAFEHHDYIVFVFDNQMDWLNIVNQFNLKRVNAGYGTTKKIGVGRVVNGKRLLELIQHKDTDTEPRQE